LFIGDDWNRVCAPDVDEGKMYSLIFWEKGAETEKPDFAKIVSGIVSRPQLPLIGYAVWSRGVQCGKNERPVHG
jgi:hypothetical protein